MLSRTTVDEVSMQNRIVAYCTKCMQVARDQGLPWIVDQTRRSSVKNLQTKKTKVPPEIFRTDRNKGTPIYISKIFPMKNFESCSNAKWCPSTKGNCFQRDTFCSASLLFFFKTSCCGPRSWTTRLLFLLYYKIRYHISLHINFSTLRTKTKGMEAILMFPVC